MFGFLKRFAVLVGIMLLVSCSDVPKSSTAIPEIKIPEREKFVSFDAHGHTLTTQVFPSDNGNYMHYRVYRVECRTGALTLKHYIKPSN